MLWELEQLPLRCSCERSNADRGYAYGRGGMKRLTSGSGEDALDRRAPVRIPPLWANVAMQNHNRADSQHRYVESSLRTPDAQEGLDDWACHPTASLRGYP